MVVPGGFEKGRQVKIIVLIAAIFLVTFMCFFQIAGIQLRNRTNKDITYFHKHNCWPKSKVGFFEHTANKLTGMSDYYEELTYCPDPPGAPTNLKLNQERRIMEKLPLYEEIDRLRKMEADIKRLVDETGTEIKMGRAVPTITLLELLEYLRVALGEGLPKPIRYEKTYRDGCSGLEERDGGT